VAALASTRTGARSYAHTGTDRCARHDSRSVSSQRNAPCDTGQSTARPAQGPAWQAVVLSWNGREDTLACLESLAAVSEPEIGVILADNGSTDGTVEAVHAAYPDVTVVRNGANLGYAGGNNAAICRAVAMGAEWVVLVNNDAVVAPNAFAALRDAAARVPEAGVLAGKVFFAEPPDLVWFAGARVLLRVGYSGRVRGYGRHDRPSWRATEPTARATGAFMAVSRAAIEAAGMLDEELFAYVEDVEWCVRIRRAGFRVIFVGSAVAWHRVSASTGGERRSTHSLYYSARNWLVTCERHAPMGRVGTAVRRGVVLAAALAQAARRPAPRSAMRAVLAGWRDGRVRRLGMRP
jgi:GT2 family glycosyltransferase